jgi:flagellar basal-body rod modification protein FlgD
MSSIGLDAVSSAGNQAATTQSNDVMGKDDFLTLLVAQLQAQDPLNPMDGTDFTAQLAQFSSLEQLQNVNTNLGTLNTSQAIQTNAGAVDFIGKQITALGNEVDIEDGQSAHIQFSLSENAATVFVHIYDENGNYIREIESGALGAGQQEISWDGYDYLDGQVPDGTYNYEVTALDGEGQSVDVTTFVNGTVTGVNYKDGQSYLFTGNQQIPMGDVVQVLDSES